MGLIKKFSSNNKSLVCVWKITETYDELTLLTKESTNIKNRIKQKEFLASRALVEKMCEVINIKFKGIKKDSNGKPFLINSNHHISISHKFPYVTAIIDQKRCGIDIEKIDEKVKRIKSTQRTATFIFFIKSKFLNKEEEKDTGENLKKIVEYWSIKETVYKINGSTIPLKNITIKNKSENLYACLVNEKDFEISTKEIDNHILSYTT